MSETPERPPTSCLAAVFEGAGKPLVLREFDVPSPTDHEALVRVDLCTLCGSDLHTITGKRTEPTPSILAHEIVGTIVQVGQPAARDLEGVSLQPGDRVTWGVCVSCFQCDRCNSGLPQKCRNIVKYGHARATGRGALAGGMAEYILLRRGSAIAKLDSRLPDEVTSPINCATATIAAAFRIAGDTCGKRVLVVGAGMLGLTAAAFADEAAAAEITVCDLNPSRRELAKRFGAHRTIDSSELAASEGGFDVVIECSGAPAVIESLVDSMDIGGRIILVGSVMDSPAVSLNPTQIVRGWLSLHGVHNYAPQDLRRAVDFVHRNHLCYPFAELVAKTFELAEINLATEFAVRNRPVRVAIRP